MLATPAVASFKDLCIDAVDPERMATFWGALLGLRPELLDDGDWLLRAAQPSQTIWVNAVPEPVTVKQRVHLDVRASAVAEVMALGATVLDADSFAWTIMRDPEGGELCVFPLRADSPPGLMEMVVDCVDPAAQATWWGEVLGVEAKHDTENGWSFLEQVPSCPMEYVVFLPVPEPKTVKNRIHWDLTVPDLSALLVRGAELLQAQEEDGIAWDVMADPEGNEFCAFVGALV